MSPYIAKTRIQSSNQEFANLGNHRMEMSCTIVRDTCQNVNTVLQKHDAVAVPSVFVEEVA